MTSRSDFKLRGHEMVEQFLPIHWSSLVSTPKTVCWTGKFLSGNYLKKIPKSSLKNFSRKLKHVIQYIGADADLWHGMAHLGVFHRMK